jgi:hypothetical protein
MDERLLFPATGRNRQSLAAVLEPLLPSQGLVLEIASGSGEHLCYFERKFAASHPQLLWQGSDPEPSHRASLRAWAEHQGCERMLEPLNLNVCDAPWPELGAQPATQPTLILCSNLLHIAPWQACAGLMAHAGRLLPRGGTLLIYGPFTEAGIRTSASNLAFDASLRQQDPSWGLRSLEAVATAASEQGLHLAQRMAMPANNLSLIFTSSRCSFCPGDSHPG